MPGLLKLPSRNRNYDSIHYLCTVKFLDDSEALSVTYQRDTKGRFLIDYVCSSIDLLEKDYFGLKYTDADKQECWIDPLKSIYSQLKGISNPLLFFHVKFYPEDPSVIKEEITRYQLFLQVRKDLEENRLICSLQDALLFSAYIVQAEFGDCIDVLPPATPQSLPYSASPPSLTHQPSSPTWKYILYVKLPSSLKGYEEDIYKLHRKLKGMKPAEAEFNFLKKASTLPSFGIDPYIVQDMKGDQLYLTVTPQGIVSFVDNQATNTYYWRSIKKMSFDGKMFYIKLKRDEDDDGKPHETGPSIFSKVVPFNKSNIHHPAVGYKCLSAPSCKQLWKNSVAHKFFYTLKSSEEAPKVVSSGGLFGRGSKFRYSGHCLSEVYKSSASIDRPQPKFTRYSSRSRPGSASAARSTTLPFSWKSINNSSSKNGDKYEREGDSSAASLSTGTTVASSVATSVQPQQPKKCTSDSALVTADGKLNDQQSSLKPLQDYKHQQNDDDHVPLLIAGDVECDFNAPYRSTDGHEVINTCEIINISDDDDDESDSDDDEILNTFNSNGKMNKNEILEINKKIETLFLNGEKLDNKMILNPNFVEYDETVMNLRTNSQYNKTGECLENNASTAAANPCSSISPPPKQSHSTSVHPGYVIDCLPSSPPATAPPNAPTPGTISSTATVSFALSDPPIITLTTTFVNIATPSQKIDSFAKSHQPFVSSSSSSFFSSQPTTYFSAATTVTSFRESPLNHGRVEESWVTESRGTRSLDGWIVEEGEKRMKYTDNSYDTGYTSSGSETVNDNEGDGEDACVKQLEGSSEKLEKPESKSGIRKSLLNLLSFVSSLNKAVEGKHGDERDARDGAEQAGQSGAENQSKIFVSDDGDVTPINPIDIVDSFSKANIVIPATALQIHSSLASPESSSSTLSVTQDLLKPSSTSKTQRVVTLTTSLSSPASYNQHVSSLSPPSPRSSSSWKGLAAPPTTPDDNIQHSPSTEETQHAHPHQTSSYSSSSYSSPSYSSSSYSSSSYSSSPSFDNPSAENYERIKEIRKLLQENKDRIQEIRNTIDNEIKKPLSCYSVSSDSIDITRQIWSEYVVTSSNSTTNKLSSPTLNNHYHNQLSRDGKEAEAVEHHSNVGGGGRVDPAVTSAHPIPISFINNQFEWCGEGGENSGGVGVIINNCIYPDVHHLANVGVCSEYVPDDVDVATDFHEQNYPDERDNKLTCGGFVGAIPNVASDVPVDGATVNADPKVNANASNETDLVSPKIDQFLTSLLLHVSSSSSSPAAASPPTISSMHGQPLQNSHSPSNRPSPGQQLQEPPLILSDSQLLESTFALLHENDSPSHAEQEGCEPTTFGEHADAHIADTSIEQHVGEVAVTSRANNNKGTMHYLGKGVCLTVASVLLSLLLFSIFVIIVFECFQEERYINDYIIIREFKSSVYDLIKQYMTEMFYRHVFRFW